MSAQKNNQKERQYYIDWLRIILILTVFLFHIGMIFNNFEWHIKNDEQYAGLAPIMSFLHLWRMPLLFLISGAGTFFALGKRTPGQYLKERFNRLIIPLIAGIFILVPVQLYFERIDQYASLFNYYPHMFDGVYPAGNFSWHHLWFIAYLFLISLMIAPFLKYFKSRKFRAFKLGLEKIVKKPAGMNFIIIPLLLSQLLLKPYFPEETHDVVNDWAFIALNLFFFLTGFLLFINPRIIHYLKKQRRIYLLEASILTILLFLIRSQWPVNFIIHETLSNAVAWTCALAAIAYGARYLNSNTPFRKLANEAIYPFYLLHQPVIIIYGYYITQWDISVLTKALLITIFSFTTSVGLYWFFIRPFNSMRVIFGMRKKKTKDAETKTENSIYFEPNKEQKVVLAKQPSMHQ
jgi:peptidoglycan/LPS O-acetylase OafA/YrhL